MLYTSSKLTSLKKGCRLMASASSSPEPRRLSGSRKSSLSRLSAERLRRMYKDTHLSQQRYCISGHRHRVKWFILENGIENVILVVALEGRLTEQHFVRQDTECPPIDSSGVPLLEQNLSMKRKSTCEVTIYIVSLTSGAMNSGVPQKVLVVLPNHMFSLHKP